MGGGLLARMRLDLSIGAALSPPGGNVRAAAARELGTHAPPGDNAGMARDGSGDRLLRRLVFMSLLDGIRPSGIPGWASPVAPVVTQAAVGAGHWAAGRRQRALAAWASAAGFGLVAWALGTEAPTRAERDVMIEQQKDLLRKLRTDAPVNTGTQAPAARQRSPRGLLYEAAF